MRKLLLFIAVLITAVPAFMEVSLPSVFSEGMVLQRNMPVKIWGWANNGEPVQVHFREQTHETVA